jgi:hypothetical protein
MSDKPAVEGRGEPAPDPVEEFMRQLSSNAARQRRSHGGGAAKVHEANELSLRKSEGAAAPVAVPKVPEAPPPPAIEGVAVARHTDLQGCWTVEAKDTEGSLFQASFQGPDAEARAREYARWKYGEEF